MRLLMFLAQHPRHMRTIVEVADILPTATDRAASSVVRVGRPARARASG
jgi:hypothetical protein